MIPPPGYTVDRAVLATYSVEPITAMTALLALGGCDLSGDREPTRVEVVKCLQDLADRVHIVGQRGRFALPRQRRDLLGLLDRFVVFADHDERFRSWHPKAAFVRYRNGDQEDRWRVWLGSLNLTPTANWDAGLVLESSADGHKVPGLAEAGRRLFEASEFPAADLGRSLDQARWSFPAGVEVTRIELHGEGRGSFPSVPPNVRKVWLVSPFLDRTALEHFRAGGGPRTERLLMSTVLELDRLSTGALANWSVRTLEEPEETEKEGSAESPSTDGVTVADETVDPTGLHAKLVYLESESGRQLWMGSANVTSRAWEGRNTEIVAELKVSSSVAESLRDFVVHGAAYRPAAARSDTEEADRLHDARKILAAEWRALQRVLPEGIAVIGVPPPLPGNVRLEIAHLETPEWRPWESGAAEVLLPALPLYARTKFIRVRLTLGSEAVAWLHDAVYDPALGEERDTLAIAQFLSPADWMLWCRNCLQGATEDAHGSTWGDPRTRRSAEKKTSVAELADIPTIEEILRAYAREPARISRVSELYRRYATEIARKEGGEGAAAVESMRRFAAVWEPIAAALLEESR